MSAIFQRTIGGLGVNQYFRHFVFGALVAALALFIAYQGEAALNSQLVIIVVLNSLLYPYSRFVYEGVANFILGDNVFLVNAESALLTKAITIALCWGLAVFVAPIGLAYLFYVQSRTAR